MSQEILIATRKSHLALWQAHKIQSLLQEKGIKTQLFPLVTTGDKMQKSQLADIHLPEQNAEHHLTTGKGLFIKEIQEALLSNKAHIAVHSMKDLPVAQTSQLSITALLPRAGARDVIIFSPELLQSTSLHTMSAAQKAQLTFGELKSILSTNPIFTQKPIGTTSARRQLLLKKCWNPHLNVQILRGNVDTRLKRVQNNEFAAILLAEAGLERLELFNHEHMFYLPISEFIPAAAQGVIAVEINDNNQQLANILTSLSCKQTRFAAGIERMVLALLGGDCHTPIGAHYDNKQLYVVCGHYENYKHVVISCSDTMLLEVAQLLNTNLYFNQFFNALCQSEFAKVVAQQLFAAGFAEVSDLKL